MHIIDIYPPPASAISARGFRTICFFDAQVTPDLRLYGLELVEAPGGKRLIYAPSKNVRKVATMSIALGDALAELVVSDGVGNDRLAENAA